MDLDYLKQVLAIRKQEIEEGKNLFTSQPIYVVLSQQDHYVSGHTDYLGHTTNNKSRIPLYGYIDCALEPECREFCLKDDDMEAPEEVTQFWTDNVVAFFLTSAAAHDYLSYQSHNLTDAYVYVFHSGYRNFEMDHLLRGN